MKNIETKIEGQKLIITIDLSQRLGTSGSGKSALIATTQGNVGLPGKEDVKMGINIYTEVGK